ncbi:MAG: hypothetical protein C0597_08000 [Marinilabiliales bacterium]|nr:MAG: hypothetical protein C0597_08000 [Marinilabiliales bacterium]
MSSNNESISLTTNIVTQTIEKNFNPADSLSVFPNKTNEMFLYLSEKRTTSVNPVNTINFFVFNKLKNEILYQNKYSNAEIEWYDNEKLLLTRYFGIIETPESTNIKKYIIDINSGVITEINKRIKSNN